MTTEIWEFLK